MSSNTTPAAWRPKRAPVEAIRFLGTENCRDTFAFIGLEHPAGDDRCDTWISFSGVETDWQADPGDWILRVGPGDHRVMSDDEFRAQYEPDAPLKLEWPRSVGVDLTGDEPVVEIPVHHDGRWIGDLRLTEADTHRLAWMTRGAVAELQAAKKTVGDA